jgi:predicted porin
MRKTQLALAAVALVASSAAMSTNVSISGNLDMAVARTSGYNGTGGMFIENGGYFDHQGININANEDLGGGLKVHGSLGAGFNANGRSDNPGAENRGANASTFTNGLFNRQSYVGLSGEFGDVRLGRQLSPFIAAMAGNMHYVGMFGVGRIVMAGDESGASSAAGGSTAGGFFRDDAIQYTTPSVGGFTGQALTTMRNATYNNGFQIDRGRYSAFSVSGPLGPVTVNAAYHAQRFSANSGLRHLEYSGYAFGGMVPIADGLSLSAGYVSTIMGSDTVGVPDPVAANTPVNTGVPPAIAGNNQRTDSWNVGLSYDLSSANKLIFNYASSNRLQNAVQPEDATLMNLMLVNSLSKTTRLYAAAGWGNRIGATIGTVGGGVNAAGNGPYTNANDAQAQRNNAVLVGVAHSF